MYGNEDGLINQIAAVSLTKSFGGSKTKDTSKKSKKDLKTTSITMNENLIEFGKLKEINEQIKAQNAKLKAENEKLKSLYAKTIKENKTSKRLIVELLKENEKIKLEKEIFKNKLLENENKELKEEIESVVADKGVNKFLVLLFFIILILLAYGITSFVMSILQNSFSRKH
jgi:Fe2+ transport system protein B